MPITIIHRSDLTDIEIQTLLKDIPGQIQHKESCYTILNESEIDPQAIQKLRSKYSFDINPIPETFVGKETGLLITDMDSTLISIECIDEIADFLNIKDQVATITESAMRGEIDFTTSLERRVGLLKNLNSDALDHVYTERLQLNPGAEVLMSSLQERGIKRVLVSGGFTYFTEKLQERLDLDDALSNTLEIIDDKLTGNVLGEIVDGSVKAEFLQLLASRYGIELDNCIAVGDGANDLPMMGVAGLSVAYHAKPAVQEQAKIVLNYSGLDAILDILDAQ